MPSYRRHRPHWIPEHSTLFVTFRLAGSLPSEPPVLTTGNTGRIPCLIDNERLDRIASGPFWLRHPRLAGLVEEALLYGEQVRQFYDHVVFDPHVPLPRIMQWLKGRSGRAANRVLVRTGKPCWQNESYDHWIRTREELAEAVNYVENSPVAAGLVQR